jgi:hypothetical protein
MTYKGVEFLFDVVSPVEWGMLVYVSQKGEGGDFVASIVILFILKKKCILLYFLS